MNPEECLDTKVCFFCKRVEAVTEDLNLLGTCIWWMGRQNITLICKRCRDFLSVPETRESMRVCDFCGYPGGNLQEYKWFGEKYEDPNGAHIITYHCDWSSGQEPLDHYYIVCQQCKDFFARNPLKEATKEKG